MIGFDAEVRALAALKAKGRLRALSPQTGHDFASNDYLGLARSEVLRNAARAALERGVPLGSGSARLLRGNDPELGLLESEAAAFFGAERCLFLANGYLANLAIFSSLPRLGDLIVHDALIHASAHDGMRLGRAETAAFGHNDTSHAEAIVTDWRSRGGTGRIWLACESVYSMEGDLAPLADLLALTRRHEAMLIVDEAHATGVFGPGGRGLGHGLGEDVLALHTCGKALGVSGALVSGAAPLIDTLINRARGFLFSTAPAPLTAALVRAALTHVQANPSLIATLSRLVAQSADLAAQLADQPRPQSQIIPVLLGDNARAMAVAAAMQKRGFDIRGIRPPTVPVGTARLRISVTCNVSPALITDMFSALAEERERVG